MNPYTEEQLELFEEPLLSPCVFCGNVPKMVKDAFGWVPTDHCARWYSYVKLEKAVLNWNCNNTRE